MVPSRILILESADVTINLLGLLGQNCNKKGNKRKKQSQNQKHQNGKKE
jgi:hypothetical protein